MTNRTICMDDTLYRYYLSIGIREPEVLSELREQTKRLSSSKMQIAPEEGQFFSFLVEILQAKKTIDIGVFTGYSALVVALALPEKGKVIACDVNVEWTKIARRYWHKANVENKIDLRIAPAAITLQQLIDNGEDNSFDFIFIDADKKNYDRYYELSLKLLRVGGVIAIDNVLWKGRVANETNQNEDTFFIRELNQKIVADDRISLSMIPIADGVTLARKRKGL